jgi:hypothetical protein
MPVMKYAAAIAAASLLAAQPCAAADDYRDRRAPESRSGAFAGLSLRMPLGDGGGARRPTARFQLTTMTSSRDTSGAVTRSVARGVELGADREGRAAFSIGGRDLRGMDDRLGFGGSTTTTLVIVGGVVLVVFVLASVAAATPRPGPSKGAFD